jgi:CRP-like cAMP-binding protein
MSTGISPGEHGDVLDWLYERGKRRAVQVPGFDAEKLMGRARAARDAGAVDFWSVLSPVERSHFESAAQLREFPPGTALMREGEQAAAVMVLRSGWTKVVLDEDGQERVIAERGPGDLVGEGGTEPGNVRNASVIALGRVQALVMTTASYAAFIDEFPNVPDLVKRQTHERRTGRPDRP